MKAIDFGLVIDEKQYDKLMRDWSVGVAPEVEEVELGPAKIMSVEGNEPPGPGQYQTAIECLYGIGYTLKMGLKHGSLPRPLGYFDYKVGSLGSLWWSASGQEINMNDPKTLRWKAYLVVPQFVDDELFTQAAAAAKTKKPEVPYENVELESFDEGHSVQVMHVGPYDAEGPTIERLHRYMKDHGLIVNGKHNEIYISDPRRTQPDKLKTVIRMPVVTL